MTAHTPGPWTYEYENSDALSGGCWYSIKAVGGDDDLLWFPYNGPRSSGEREEANARLMAAAPELLDAARTALEWAERYEDLCDEGGGIIAQDLSAVRAAIAKATQP